MKRFLFLNIIVLFSLQLFGADRVIRGKVTSATDQEELIGVSVFVPKEELNRVNSDKVSLGTSTNFTGEFTLTIPASIKKISFRYVGFNTATIELTSEDFYSVELESSDISLQEVVVTGYQTIEKRKMTASISKIDISEEKIGSVRSIDQALSGQIAGLAVTTSSGALSAPPKIRIRGTSSLNGTQDPLWVLDGLPLEGTDIPKMEDLKDIDNINSTSIAGLNPADIESITVLKDAAATAIYGARAANGVIIISTKKGKKGKPVINFSTRQTFVPTVDINRLNLMNSQEKVDLELSLLQSDFTYRANKGAVARILNGLGEMGTFKSGGWNAISTQAQNDILNLKQLSTDWNNILFQNAYNQDYNISVAGGGENATYYTSVGYYNEKGNVAGVGANRFNILSKINFNLGKSTKLGVSLYANQRNNKSFLADYDGFTNPVYYSRRANSYQQVYDDSGNYVYDTDIQGRGDSDLQFNIFEEQNNTSNTNKVNSLSAIFDAEIRFTEQLKLISQLGLQTDQTSIERIAENNSYAMRKDKERALRTYPDGTKKSFLPVGGKHTQNENKLSQITGKLMGEYRNQFGSGSEFEAMLGTEIRRTWFQTLFSAGYGFEPQTLTTKPVIFPKEEDARYFPLHTKTFTENAFVSAFSTVSYTYKHKYTLGGSIRFDGSDIFGVDKRYRYLPLYSVSGLWRISNEEFMKDLHFINNAVIRSSYGLQGNIDKNTSPFVVGYYQTSEILPGTPENKIVISSPPNKKLRWEKTQTFNAGLDVSLFKQSIDFSIDYYYRLGTDLIGMQMLPLETGFSSTMINWASMKNEGVEFSLTTRNIHTPTFMWHTNLNIGYNNNKVLKESIPGNQTTPSREGYSVGAIFAYKSAGLDNEGYPLFTGKDGQAQTAKDFFQLERVGAGTRTNLSAEAQRNLYTYIGSSDPLISGGLINTFTIKRFEISVNAIFNLGFYVRTAPSYSLTEFDRGMNANRDILNRWTPENKASSFPTLITNGKRIEEFNWFDDFNINASMDNWVKRGDFMRIQSIRTSYRLPESWMNQIFLKSGTIALEARNLFVIAKDYTNFLDPETMGNPFAQPIPKSFVFSISLSL